MNAIHQDYYVLSTVDDFYIPQRLFYQTEHFIHEILVYGCNPEKELFHIVGFDNRMIFLETEINFQELETAYKASFR